MARSENKPTTRLPDVPPDWVPFIDLPRLIARRFGLSETEKATMAVALTEAVWWGSLRPAHRVAGAVPYGVRRHWWPPGLVNVEPSWLGPIGGWDWKDTASQYGSRVIADDWDRAQVDRVKTTVAGRELTDGTTERLVIEIYWPAALGWAVAWVASCVDRAKTQEGIGGAASGAASSTPPVTTQAPRRRGRRDYREADDVLAREVIEGVASGRFSGEWVGCLELADKADGVGVRLSKAPRLYRRVRLLCA